MPGNGDGDVTRSNFYGWLQRKLQGHPAFGEVVLRDMPDPIRARRKIWLPFLRDEMKVDERTVLIGHSSGAVAAMRLLEEGTRVFGCVLISACHTDLGDANERGSGYYPPSGGPWRWEKIVASAGNHGNIRILHSDNDPFIPLEEAEHVAKNLKVPLQIEKGKSHFFSPTEAIFEAVVAAAEHE